MSTSNQRPTLLAGMLATAAAAHALASDISVIGPAPPQSLSARLTDLPAAPAWHPGISMIDMEPGQEDIAGLRPSAAPWRETVRVPAASAQAALPWRAALGGSLNMAGTNFTGALPADPSGDAGPGHYVQMVNGAQGTMIAVYDKNSGALLSGPSAFGNLATGTCSNDGGDPQVLYDMLAGRWLLAALGPNSSLCVLVSSGSNPLTSTWQQYQFSFPYFPDYPKLAVWQDAYGLTSNSFFVEGNNVRMRFAVLDRNAMLAGTAATAQSFDTVRVSNGVNPFAPMTPVGFKGHNAPKAGTPIPFLIPIDEEYQFFGEPAEMTFGADRLMLYSVLPDFANATQTVVTGPVSVPVGEMQLYVGTVPRQPNNQYLPAFAGTPMHRSTYRNLGDREVIVLSMSQGVDPFTDYDDINMGLTMGVHWLELERRGGAAGTWQVANQGTWGGGDGASRFMPAIGVDSAGNLALAYTTMRADPAIHPSLRSTGRRAGDAPNTMTLSESEIATGTQSQLVGANQIRWGDYFDLSIDPDGCRFWFTGAYMDDASWGTRIAALQHEDCGPPSFVLSSPHGPFEVCSADAPTTLPTQTLHVDARNGYWRDVVLTAPTPPAGVTVHLAPALIRPSGTASVDLSVAQGTTTGLKTVRVRGEEGVLASEHDFLINVTSARPPAPALSSPADAAIAQPNIVRLQWNPVAGAVNYDVEVSIDAAFTPPFVFARTTTDTFVDTSVLSGNTRYYWRVRARNACGAGTDSATRFFNTVSNFCFGPSVTPLPAGGTLSRDLAVSAVNAGTLQNLDTQVVVNNIPASDLSVTVTRLSDVTAVSLWNGGCNAGTSINTVFDDAATASACSGSPLASRTKPSQALTLFDGGQLAGNWRITITNGGASSGQFILWCLQPQLLLPTDVFGNGFE